MKFNKWTLGLAAVGVVSLASVAQAEEKNALQTALSATTISGYVDTSAQWNPGTGNANLPWYKFGGAGKADGFNLNVVQLSIAKPLDESEWAAGYKADLWFGPDAKILGTDSYIGLLNIASDFAIRQAYVALRAPVGNGLDFKMGVFDTIIGYESLESGNNPNYTRSYGHSIEPQTHTGLLATYRFNDMFSAAIGVANTIGPSINARAHPTPIDLGISGVGSIQLPLGGSRAESYKTYMGSLAFTAPQDWGWAAGSTLYGGVVNGFNGPGAVGGQTQTSWYVGGTLATPVTGLRLGAAFDYLDIRSDDFDMDRNSDVWSVAGYGSYQATEKLSLHGRGEYLKVASGGPKIFALTGTVQYDLWQNVISRLEFRWDHAADGCHQFGGKPMPILDGEDGVDIGDIIGGILDGTEPTRKNAYMVALNVIYKF
jgi:hypothetical protein